MGEHNTPPAGEDVRSRNPRPVRLTERVYRVVAYDHQVDPHVTTWTYKRLSDAEWRAKHVHQLVDFSYADIEWKPQPLGHIGRTRQEAPDA